DRAAHRPCGRAQAEHNHAVGALQGDDRPGPEEHLRLSEDGEADSAPRGQHRAGRLLQDLPRETRRRRVEPLNREEWIADRQRIAAARRQQRQARSLPLNSFRGLLQPTYGCLNEPWSDYFRFTAFFSSTPGVNFATLRAAILITDPV